MDSNINVSKEELFDWITECTDFTKEEVLEEIIQRREAAAKRKIIERELIEFSEHIEKGYCALSQICDVCPKDCKHKKVYTMDDGTTITCKHLKAMNHMKSNN